ncbi:Gibberellin regulated protein [Corchorus capsularis]|uniref:Gibberellin regulated protein n=1 Tax=Corchorus capsularis TaxID=210143 RepID=A0A1R3JXV1_COCAP|nr:Gibberellin regulated protein [Corchorus capsularis]
MARTKTATLSLALLCLVLLSEVGMLMALVQTPPAGAPAPQACCHRCPDHCVPDGPKASRDTCSCYSKIMTHGKYKCP